MLVAMGTEKGETKDDVISTGDIAVAFLQGYNFDKTLEVQYVGHTPYTQEQKLMCGNTQDPSMEMRQHR